LFITYYPPHDGKLVLGNCSFDGIGGVFLK